MCTVLLPPSVILTADNKIYINVICIYIYKKQNMYNLIEVKVKVTLEQVVKSQRESRGIALLFL
jgi:hypothetical protein